MPASALSPPQQRILDAAKEVFAENGYRGGSLNEVATRAGYTRAGLLHHYPSKEAILLALLDRRDERLHAYGEPGEDESLSELLAELPAVVEVILEDRVLIQLAHAITAEASDPEHPAHDWASQRHHALRHRLVSAIARSVDQGELSREVDAEALAALILGAVEGVEAQWLVNPEVDPAECARTLGRLVDAFVATADR